MSQDPIEQGPSLLNPNVVRAKIKEADLYVSRGLFDQAREIYRQLLSQYAAHLKSGRIRDPNIRNRVRNVAGVIRDRLKATERWEAVHHKRQAPPKPGQKPRRIVSPSGFDRTTILQLSGTALYDRGMAYKDMGLVDEAIEAFRRSARLGYREAQSLLVLSECFLAKKAFPRALRVLRALLDFEGIKDPQKALILQRIAAVHEAAGDLKEALKALQEAYAFDRRSETLRQKIGAVTKEMRRIRPRISIVTEHPVASFVLCLLVAFFFMSFLPKAQTVNNVDYFTLDNDPDVAFYDEFKEVFGNDEFFVIAFEREDIFTERNLDLLARLTEDLEGLEDIDDVTSLANVDDIVGGEDFFEVRGFLEEIPSDPQALEKLKKQAVRNPLYVANLISRDARTTAIVVQTLEKPEDPDYRKKLLAKAQKILDPYRSEVERFHLAGWTTTNYYLSQYMKKDVATFIPVAYLFITLAIWLVFRNIRLTLLAVMNISFCVGSTMGLFGLTGITLNNVTSIIPPLVMALALCDVVHIFSHMEKQVLESFPDKRKALAHVLDKVLLPSFLTTLTTAIGFLSLAVSQIPPIRELAWIASAGMVFEFFFSFFFLPPIILLFDPKKIYQAYETKRGMLLFLRALGRTVSRRRGFVLAASAVVVCGAAWYTTQLRVETNLIEFFKKSSPLRVSMDFVERKLGGVDTMDISLQAREEEAFKDPKNLKLIESIQEYLKKLEAVDSVVSLVDFLKDMNESFHAENHAYYKIPETKNMVSQYLLLYDSEDIEDVINSSFDHARIAMRISEHSSAAQKRLIRQIEQFIQTLDHPGIEIRVTGRARQDVNTIDALVRGQVQSLSLAAAIILVVMMLVLRSFSIGLLSVIPNLFPIVLNFGIMGALSIPLDTGTSLIAAVALGIAVDDTIHFLSEYKLRRSEGFSVGDSVWHVILNKGRPIISTSVILCIGFGVLMLSSFSPTMNFGILCSIIMITAAVGDILVLPSVILLRKSRA
ncbi:MAG: MMPL family transporter [Deltaproteobacteria bacterium]|nr:MMPL family transporter [Deltaproteobacteria bacterium]MBW2349009.1 MMPL family transporter [Deltaproteobacteria bacterium]